MSLDITVGGRLLKADCLFGDVTMSTVWPGGSDELSWTPGSPPARKLTGGEDVVGLLGGLVPKFAGKLIEPDASQDTLTAQGAWREADGFEALTSGGAAANNVNNAVDAAIVRGLNWTRSFSFGSPAGVDVDLSQGPITLGALLDAWTEQSGQRWGVDPYRQVYAKVDDTAPTYQTFPLDGGLGFALGDTYASTLVGRYYNGTAYATVVVDGDDTHGYQEAVVDLTVRGTLTLAKATTILTNLLALGRAVPQWTASIELTYGEILTMGGVPVALESVAANGNLLRVHGGYELAQRLNGAMYLDVPIGATSLAAGVLTVTPAQLADRTLTDVLTAALSKK